MSVIYVRIYFSLTALISLVGGDKGSGRIIIAIY